MATQTVKSLRNRPSARISHRNSDEYCHVMPSWNVVPPTCRVAGSTARSSTMRLSRGGREKGSDSRSLWSAPMHTGSGRGPPIQLLGPTRSRKSGISPRSATSASTLRRKLALAMDDHHNRHAAERLVLPHGTDPSLGLPRLEISAVRWPTRALLLPRRKANAHGRLRSAFFATGSSPLHSKATPFTLESWSRGVCSTKFGVRSTRRRAR